MNALAIIYVNDHLETLHAEARRARLASLAGAPTLRNRLGSALRGLLGGDPSGSMLGGDSSGSIVPRLNNYPSGG